MKNEAKKSKKVEFSLQTIQSNQVMRKQLEGFVEEIYLAKTTIKNQQEAIKDICIAAKDTLGIPGKVLGMLVKERMQTGTIEVELDELEIIQAISQALNGEQPTQS